MSTRRVQRPGCPTHENLSVQMAHERVTLQVAFSLGRLAGGGESAVTTG